MTLTEFIRDEVEHRCDVFTDGDWFQDKIKQALCELLFPDVESCDGECSTDLLEMLRKALNE
jgi:hypothetical protein|tara:strand:- start:76 stop:261 length:186 start_codon:yes stop_codon:yes gene_type:complete